MEKKFDIKTSLFRLPQGTSPDDAENINLVKRIMKSATGADSVEVNLHRGPNGALLTDLYEVKLAYPDFMQDNNYVLFKKDAALDGNAANLLANIIKGLASGGDVKGDVQKLMQIAEQSGQGEEESPLGGGAGSAAKPGAPGSSAPGPGSGLPGISSNPPGGTGGGSPFGGDAEKKKPFASSKLKMAMTLEQYLGIPLRDGIKVAKTIQTPNFENFVKSARFIMKDMELEAQDAIDLVNLVHSSRSFKDFHTKAASVILDENDKPLSAEEYSDIARKVAQGEKAPLV
jgi:hypothetical protein